MESDPALLRASLDDPERFGVLFDRHHRVVWTYLARLSGPDVADELAADVFVTAFERRGSYDAERGEVRSWLYGIATNLLRTRLRSEERSRRAFMRAANLGDVGAGPYEAVDDADELARLSRAVLLALAKLSREQRELFALYAWEGLAYRQIAAALDLPVGTVRSRLSRSRKRMRELLGGVGEVLIETGNQPRPQEAT